MSKKHKAMLAQLRTAGAKSSEERRRAVPGTVPEADAAKPSSLSLWRVEPRSRSVGGSDGENQQQEPCLR